MEILILTLIIITLFIVVIIGVTIKEITSYIYEKRRYEFLTLKRNDKVIFLFKGEKNQGRIVKKSKYNEGALCYIASVNGPMRNVTWNNFVKKINK